VTLALLAWAAAAMQESDVYAAREAASSRAAGFEGGATVTGADITLAIFLISLPVYFILWVCGVDLS
jgi:hypothetical protein